MTINTQDTEQQENLDLNITFRAKVVCPDGLHMRPTQELQDVLMAGSCRVSINGLGLDTKPDPDNHLQLFSKMLGLAAVEGSMLQFYLRGLECEVTDLSTEIKKLWFLKSDE